MDIKLNTFKEFSETGIITILKHKNGGEDLKIAYVTDKYALSSNGEIYALSILSEYDIIRQELLHKTRGFEIVDNNFRKHPNTDIILPRRADNGSCAYDWYSPIDITIEPNEQVLIWSDIKSYMKQNEVLVANVRSSQGKARIQLANTQGWIDSTYYNSKESNGNICFFIRNEGLEKYIINKGDRIMQTMFINYLVADNDKPISNKRIGGLGSSGK